MIEESVQIILFAGFAPVAFHNSFKYDSSIWITHIGISPMEEVFVGGRLVVKGFLEPTQVTPAHIQAQSTQRKLGRQLRKFNNEGGGECSTKGVQQRRD